VRRITIAVSGPVGCMPRERSIFSALEVPQERVQGGPAEFALATVSLKTELRWSTVSDLIVWSHGCSRPAAGALEMKCMTSVTIRS
jgi:hypothetical protein